MGGFFSLDKFLLDAIMDSRLKVLRLPGHNSPEPNRPQQILSVETQSPCSTKIGFEYEARLTEVRNVRHVKCQPSGVSHTPRVATKPALL